MFIYYIIKAFVGYKYTKYLSSYREIHFSLLVVSLDEQSCLILRQSKLLNFIFNKIFVLIKTTSLPNGLEDNYLFSSKALLFYHSYCFPIPFFILQCCYYFPCRSTSSLSTLSSAKTEPSIDRDKKCVQWAIHSWKQHTDNKWKGKGREIIKGKKEILVPTSGSFSWDGRRQSYLGMFRSTSNLCQAFTQRRHFPMNGGEVNGTG